MPDFRIITEDKKFVEYDQGKWRGNATTLLGIVRAMPSIRIVEVPFVLEDYFPTIEEAYGTFVADLLGEKLVMLQRHDKPEDAVF